ncbi:Hypothetical protein A7982_05795 [Minicystis rosea]|nr:Hypothetical protein A7982_05795 [Minicystis rosea]
MRIVSILLLPVLAAACSNSQSAQTDDCSAAGLEPDLVDAVPLSGPGVDTNTGKLAEPGPDGYIVSTTWGIVRPDDASQEKSKELITSIMPTLVSSPGLVAFQMRTSQSCRSGRTLTVWRDVASMFDFVGSPAHGSAMSQVDVVNEAFKTTHYTAATADEISWANAVDHLGDPMH